MTMRIITVRQPWASLIAVGEKTVENRRWAASYRGPVAIHAGLEPDRAAYRRPDVLEALADQGLPTGPGQLPRGVVVAVAELSDSHPTEGLCCPPWGEEKGVQHLLLGNVRALREPLPWQGALGLLTVGEDDEATIRARL